MGKTTRGFILGLTTAAAAVGAYYIITNKDKIFKTEEIVNEDGTVTKKRSYVDLSNIKNKTSEIKDAAQDKFDKVKDKVESKKKNKKNDDIIEEAVEIVDEVAEEVKEEVTEEVKEEAAEA